MLPPQTHSLFVAHVAVGHCRPLLALALNLLTINPHLHITFLASDQVASKLLAEKDRFALEKDVLARFHLVFFGSAPSDKGASLVTFMKILPIVMDILGNFQEAYGKLLKGEPLVDSHTNTVVPSFDSPISKIVVDFLVLQPFCPIKQAVEDAVLTDTRRIATISFAPIESSFIAAYFFRAPNEVWPPFYKAALEVQNAPGNTLTGHEIYEKIGENNDTRVEIIGVGEVYMYELQPSVARVRIPDGWLEFMTGLVDVHRSDDIDGIIVVYDGDLNPAVSLASKSTFEKFWEVGPQLPPVEWERGVQKVKEFAVEEEKGEVVRFLDRALEEEGEESVMLISFGSLFAIPLIEHLEILLDTLLELKMRFILTQGVLAEDFIHLIETKVARSEGKGLMVVWSPQNAVLAHKATSFFLTHCGSNSVHEAILHQVPMIAWPGTVDQATLALSMDVVHHVAFELLQVRTEYNITRPTARGPVVEGTPKAVRAEFLDVFERMKGEEGQAMRKRIKKMREVLVKSRAEGGRSWRAMREVGGGIN